MVMAFKLAGALKNGVLITILNAQQGTKKMMSKWLGVPPDNYEPTATSVGASLADVTKHFALKMQGKEDSSKLWLLAKELDFMPDNYYFSEEKTNFYSDSIRFAPSSYAFMFHNMVETYGALMQLSIILRSMQLQNAKGEKFSAYDAYEVKDGKLVWTKGLRGRKQIAEGVFEDLTSLDLNEAKTIRRAYERLQGSYRTEEKTAIEAHVLGGFLFQFKKFFFRYLKDWLASPYKDETLGRYVQVKNVDKPSDVPVWQWESQLMEGRLNVLVGGMIALTQGKKARSDYFGQKNLEGAKGSRAKLLMELANTALWMLGLYVM